MMTVVVLLWLVVQAGRLGIVSHDLWPLTAHCFMDWNCYKIRPCANHSRWLKHYLLWQRNHCLFVNRAVPHSRAQHNEELPATRRGHPSFGGRTSTLRCEHLAPVRSTEYTIPYSYSYLLPRPDITESRPLSLRPLVHGRYYSLHLSHSIGGCLAVPIRISQVPSSTQSVPSPSLRTSHFLNTKCHLPPQPSDLGFFITTPQGQDDIISRYEHCQLVLVLVGRSRRSPRPLDNHPFDSSDSLRLITPVGCRWNLRLATVFCRRTHGQPRPIHNRSNSRQASPCSDPGIYDSSSAAAHPSNPPPPIDGMRS